MSDMQFTALLAMGQHQSNGAVLDVTAASAEVRDLVIEDIVTEGDREFIDVLGAGLPTTGLVKVMAELEGWPSEYESPNYKMISVKTVALPG